MNSVQVLRHISLRPILMFSFYSYVSTRFLFCGAYSKSTPPSHRLLESIWLGHHDECSAKYIISGAERSPDRQVKVIRFAVEPKTPAKRLDRIWGPPSVLIRGVKLPSYPQRSPRNDRNCTFTPTLALSFRPPVKHFLLMYEKKYPHTK
jgi:hypothetical protein